MNYNVTNKQTNPSSTLDTLLDVGDSVADLKQSFKFPEESENKIGDLMYIRAVYGHGGRLNYNKEWRFNKKLSGGGELIDKGSHLIDLSRFFLGNLKTDKHKLKTTFWNMKLEDNCFLILKSSKLSML
mgnify:CR=1 FL=1